MSASPIITMQTIKNDLLQWESVAAQNGMTKTDIERQNAFISSKLEAWIGNWAESRTIYIKKGPLLEDPARSVEFLVQGTTVTVITHFKQKNGLSPLGIGYQAFVKKSVVSLALDFFNDTKPALPTNTLIADKVPKKGPLHEYNKKALEKEGKIIGQLQSAMHIRKLVANVQDRENRPGILLVAMESTVSSIMKNNYTFDQATKISIAKGLITALQELKAKNIVHRDLHPDNCARSYDDKWLIHDFGLACSEGQKIPHGTLMNIYYSSPAILEDRVHQRDGTARTVDDAWALGLVLYEIDSGQKPDMHIDAYRLLQALQNPGLDDQKAALHRYKEKVNAFIESLKRDFSKSNLLLRKTILHLLKGSDLQDCLNQVLDLESSKTIKEKIELVKASDSTEDLSGYLTAEQLTHLFG